MNFSSLKYYLTPKRLLIAGVGCVILIVTITLIATLSGGSGDKDDINNLPIMERVAKMISKEKIRDDVKLFAGKPHPAGGDRNLELGKIIKERWESYGFDSVFNNDYQVLLSLPTDQSYIKYEDITYQPTNEGDNIAPFNAFAKNGLVTGQVVYVNYGRVEDFEILNELSVDLTGKIALCRYGKIFRGSKGDNAFKNGMAGMILYSDPQDSGTGKGKVFPDGQWLPDTGVQRGNVKSVKGDISTHLYPSYEGGYHATLTDEEVAAIAPKIPVIPIPYVDAKKIQDLIGDVQTAPEGWGGHNIGPSTVKVELNVENSEELKLCRNVIGVINGAEEPDRYIIVGVHRDAWINGAVDPVSGMATILEISRAFGELLKTGWRPRRSIIFASWDAEEPGIMGSYEFVEDYLTQLKHKAVVYVNMDSAVSNPHMLGMQSTPNLFNLLYKTAKNTTSPDAAYENMFDFWVGREEEHKGVTYEEPPIGLIGSGSDYTAFLNEVGISCISFSYRTNYGTYPVYHTQYDTYEWLSTYGDKDFSYHQKLGEYAAKTILTLATEPLIPMSATTYAEKLSDLTKDFIKRNDDRIRELNLDIVGMTINSDSLLEASIKFEQLVKDTENNNGTFNSINDKLMMMERQFIHEHGLPNRPSFRHLLFAPSSVNTYAGSAFPGIVDELIKDDGGEVKQQMGLLNSKLEALIRSLDPEQSFL